MLSVMGWISIILWIVLIFTGINVLAYYIYSFFTKGSFDQETLKYAIMLCVGSYFCLILDKNKIYDALNIKKDLPRIGQIEKRKK